jgi:tRNA pseudouridine55 synthase
LSKKKTDPRQIDGVLALNKPKGPTSAACLGMIKRKLGQPKIGHAGTLDPMAEGVLLVLLGQATKISSYLLDFGQKIYGATLEFGVRSDTWDAEGRILDDPAPEFLQNALQAALSSGALSERTLGAEIAAWLGKLTQEVPPYSAAKHQGKPLYALARKGLDTPVKTKTVEISRAELEWFRPPLARFRVACSSGTYIRSLAHSLGVRFGCGAMLKELTREYSHPFSLDQAVNLDDLLADPDLLPQKARGIRYALPALPAVALSAEMAGRLRAGGFIRPEELPPISGDKALFLGPDGRELCLAEQKTPPGRTAREMAQMVWGVGRGLWNE